MMANFRKGFHSWFKKGPWQQYGSYMYKEDECKCGCIRRTVINDDGYEVIESYTIDENVTIKAEPCTASKYKSKKKNKGKKLKEFKEWQTENFLIINIPTNSDKVLNGASHQVPNS